MMALGARVAEFLGTFGQLEALLGRLDDAPTWYEATTTRAANPYQGEGPKTIAYELVAQLDGVPPDWVVVPVGGGGTLFGIWRGFRELQRLGHLSHLPRFAGVQPARFNTLEVALRRGLITQPELDGIRMDERVETVARNLKHGAPPDGAEALRAIRESRGTAMSVTDSDALAWQARLASAEGLFCEPSSATTAAAVDALVRARVIRRSDTVIGLITGSGFRELGALGPAELHQLPAEAVLRDLDRILPL
jgi:threonine synthase